MPSVKTHYALDEAGLAALLLAAAAGSLAMLFVAGRLVARLGVARCVQTSAVGLAVSLALLLHAPGLPALVLLMLLLGASMGLFDVAINAEGTLLELRLGRRLMGRLHALFSIGGMAGAALASAMFAARVGASGQLAALALLVAAASLRCAPRLLGGLAAQPAAPAPAPAGWRRTAAHGVVWLLGLLTLAAMVAEGAMYDWSVLYLVQELQQPAAAATLGFAVFAGAMAAARLGVDAARSRWGEGALLAAGAALAAAAMALLLLTAQPALAFAGFALVGIGLAPAVPILYTAAARIPGVPGASGIAAVSSIGYAAFMIGPPLVGGLARAWSLPAALGVVVLACALLAGFGRRLP
ncbi:MAG: MFS transporter [Comamonadaceae bacterium]|nr:MFS transporter [Rubrivivax sp.]NLZ41780.1 MFS transporter [Comamonadaceae bacterium]